MKARNLTLLPLVALSLWSGSAKADIIGYANIAFQPGDNWFGNPLKNQPLAVNDRLSSEIPTAPEGTKVSLLNGPSATFTGGAWTTDFALNPGTGADLWTPSQFINTFVGTVLDFNGSLANAASFHKPPPFSGPAGLYLLSSKAPTALSGVTFNTPNGTFDVFEAIIGRTPRMGEQVTTLDPLTQVQTTSTFDGGAWDHVPTLSVGEAALFDIVVPEPGVGALALLGLGALFLRRKQ